MAHYFEECMVSCQDPRLNKVHFELMGKRGMIGQTDNIFWGNPILDLVEPEHPRDKEFVLKKIGIAVVAHKVKVIRLYNHFDCGYYQLRGVKFAPEEKAKEEERLTADLRKAARIIKETFTDAKFEICAYLLEEENDGNWHEKEIK